MCGCVWVCAACLFRLKSRHLSSRWNWASLLPRNAQIVCTHFSSSFPSSHCTRPSPTRYLAILNFPALVFANFPKCECEFQLSDTSKFCWPSQGELEEQFKQWTDKGKESKSSASIASCSCYCWSPLPLSSPLFPLPLFPSSWAAFVKWRAQRKLLVMRRAVRKFAWQSSWPN